MSNRRVDFGGELYKSRGWVCLDLPQEASAALGKRGRIPVTGTLNGVPIRTSVFPTGERGHFMLINKQMQNDARIGAGD